MSYLYRCIQAARAMEGAVSVVELYEAPAAVLEEMEQVLSVEGDEDLKRTLDARAAIRKAHQAVMKGKTATT